MTVQDVALRHVEVAPLHEGAFDKVLNPLDGRDLFTRHCRLHMRQQRRQLVGRNRRGRGGARRGARLGRGYLPQRDLLESTTHRLDDLAALVGLHTPIAFFDDVRCVHHGISLRSR